MINRLLFLLLGLIGLGTVGYMFIENWSFLDSLYMTVITLTTTGFKEVGPLGSAGKIFTILILLVGVVAISYILSSITVILSEGEFKRSKWRKKMEKRIASMKNHTILCGYGRMGQAIAREFQHKKSPFMVVEANSELEAALQDSGVPYLIGDAANEETLIKAGIAHARALISVVSTDAQNVYTILTARELSKELNIVARALDEKAQKKILHAGANQVICPYAITSTHMAKTVLDPAANDFINFTLARDYNVELADIPVHAKSALVGKLIEESDVRKRGIIIVGIKKVDGELVFAPSPKHRIVENERIIALGPREVIEAFNASV